MAQSCVAIAPVCHTIWNRNKRPGTQGQISFSHQIFAWYDTPLST